MPDMGYAPEAPKGGPFFLFLFYNPPNKKLDKYPYGGAAPPAHIPYLAFTYGNHVFYI